jgi:LPS-assembly protein
VPSNQRTLPKRRLLTVAVAVLLTSGAAGIVQAKEKRAAVTEVGQPSVEKNCPLGSFICPPRPTNFNLCHASALLSFYDPALTHDSTLRATALTKTQSDTVDGSDNEIYHMQGNVRLERADQLLQADEVFYNDDTTSYDAIGNVRYQEAGSLMSADRIRGTTTPEYGNADHVKYQMLTSRGNGVADHAELLDPQHSKYFLATYSTCDVGTHLWEFRAKTIVIDKDTGVGTARKGTMRMWNVPFLYLPYFTFPVDDRRKSGFLYPTFGSSSHSGAYLSTPYYLNLAPNYDATIDPRIYSERGPMLTGEVRYLLPKSTGVFNFEYLAHDYGTNDGGVTSDQGDSKQRYLVKYIDSTVIAPGWALGLNINRASDNQYFRDFNNDLYTASTGLLASSAYVTTGGKWWSAAIGADTYQNTDSGLPNYVTPYKRWPRATFNLDIPISRWLEFGMTTEAVAFKKSDPTPGAGQVDGNRLDLEPYLSADFQGAYWFIKPKIAYRYTGYDLASDYQAFGYKEKDPSRALPIASVDAGLIFDRTTNLFGTSYTQTLEPRVYYLYVPYRNQYNQPLFDSGLNTFDYWELFAPNQYSGADRQMNANNITAAVTTRFLDDTGVERFSASLGQIRYLTPQRVQILPTVPVTDFGGSDFVAQASLQLDDKWRASASYLWNPNRVVVDPTAAVPVYNGRETDVSTITLQRRIGTDGVLNFSYRYRRDNADPTGRLLEQFDTSAVYPISERWRAIGRWTWSRKDRQTIEADAGVEYDSCCVAVRLIGRHYVSQGTADGSVVTLQPVGESTNAVIFELEFKGLGSLAPQTGDFLRRAILGYQ